MIMRLQDPVKGFDCQTTNKPQDLYNTRIICLRHSQPPQALHTPLHNLGFCVSVLSHSMTEKKG